MLARRRMFALQCCIEYTEVGGADATEVGKVWWEDIQALVVASVLGAVVGIERELHGRPAGLRTHILLSLGAALFGIVSRSMGTSSADPTRIAAQVVTGIGFIGAGTILHLGGTVRGLTTAASIWCTAAIGLSIGLSQQFWMVAAAATVIAFLTLFVLHFVEDLFWRSAGARELDVICRSDEANLSRLLEALQARRIEVEAVRQLQTSTPQQKGYRLLVRAPAKTNLSQMVDVLIGCEGVEEVRMH